MLPSPVDYILGWGKMKRRLNSIQGLLLRQKLMGYTAIILVPVRLSGTVLSYQSVCLVLCSHTSQSVWYCALIPVRLSGTVLSYQSDCLVLCSHTSQTV